jgi:hypothetical protein
LARQYRNITPQSQVSVRVADDPSNPTKRTLDMDRPFLSYRGSAPLDFTFSQRDPRYCEAVGRSILNNAAVSLPI